MDFTTHMQQLAEEFIGTVLFVDDQISDKACTNENTAAGNMLSDALHGVGKLKEPSHADAGKAYTDPAHLLRVKELSMAFSEKGILCSLIATDMIATVEEQTDLVNKVSKFSNKADVIVLDWAMEDESAGIEIGATARKIVEKLKSDSKDRDLLICIFSAEIAEKVGAQALSEGHVKVFHASKNHPRAYEELPQTICKEFAEIYSGIMPAAALSAIKVIRDNTHRILSLYSAEHDAAYLSHRCLLPRPEDAEVFATELMAATFEDLMRGNESITRHICCEVLGAWVDSKCQAMPHRELSVKQFGAVLVDNQMRKQWLEIGLTKWMHGNLPKNQGESGEARAKKIEKRGKDIKGIGQHFSHNPSDDEVSRQASFAKITSHAFADAINNNASTFLSLGSILRSDSGEYFMCIQPLCDSVRLQPNNNKFLFLKLAPRQYSSQDTKFNIVITDINSTDIYLGVDETISNIELFLFPATLGNDKVIMRIGEPVPGKETESTDIVFTFLAQLKSGQAQRIAMKFLHEITRIGLDESEWLRRHGN